MMTFDLGDYNFDLDDTPKPDKPVDGSGKPRPTTAFLVTADGHRLAADIVYDGIDEDSGDRRYALIVESDWLTLRLVACEVDRLPGDVRLMFKQPGNFDPDALRRLAEMLSQVNLIVGAQPRPFNVGAEMDDGSSRLINDQTKWVD